MRFFEYLSEGGRYKRIAVPLFILSAVIIWMFLMAWEVFSTFSGGIVPFFRPTSWISVSMSVTIVILGIIYLEQNV